MPPKKLSDYRKWAAVRIEALNHALRGLPEERTRYHVCWGSWNGPHAYDVELKNIVDLILKVRVGPVISWRWLIRATSMSGEFGKVYSCRQAACSFLASSRTRRTSSSIPRLWPSVLHGLPSWLAVTT